MVRIVVGDQDQGRLAQGAGRLPECGRRAQHAMRSAGPERGQTVRQPRVEYALLISIFSARVPPSEMRPEAAGMAQATALTIARVRTVAFIGLEVAEVDVEVQLSAGLPSFTIVGLADKAVAESRERVRAALAAMGLALPPRADHRQPGAGRPRQGGQPFRPADRAGRCWSSWACCRSTRSSGTWSLGELALDGAHPRGGRRAAGGGGGGRARARPDLPGRLRRRRPPGSRTRSRSWPPPACWP